MLEINVKIDWGLQSKQSVYLVVLNGKEQNIPGKRSKSIQGRLKDFQAEIFLRQVAMDAGKGVNL